MFGRLKPYTPTLILMLLSACGLARCTPEPLSGERISELYAAPLTQPADPMRIYYIGHSLIARDMPAMVAQLADAGLEQDGHGYESQLGWGASLKSHWEPDEPINGFDVENNHPRYRDSAEALESGEYDALVMTEMVEIRDAIKYFDSWDYLARFARKSWEHNPQTRVYLYETWHPTDDPEGWLTRLDRDLDLYWEGEILDRALAADGIDRPIYVIPGGQVFAAFIRAAAEMGGVDGISQPNDLFKINAEGEQDTIHPNDLGTYLVALTQYAVIYQRSPEGLPRELMRADGTPADAPGPAAAALMQKIVWEVVTSYPRTGVPQRADG